jgi:hypothetical protein
MDWFLGTGTQIPHFKLPYVATDMLMVKRITESPVAKHVAEINDRKKINE